MFHNDHKVCMCLIRFAARFACLALIGGFSLTSAPTRAQAPTPGKSVQPIDEALQFNPGYIAPIASQANQIAVEAATRARSALNGVPVRIPADWRLVNVIPKGNDYVMFFQSANGDVRSLRMQADGAISGQGIIWLRAHQ